MIFSKSVLSNTVFSIFSSVQNVMRYHGAKGNLSTSSTAVEIEDKFDVLIDANDQILERVVSQLGSEFSFSYPFGPFNW